MSPRFPMLLGEITVPLTISEVVSILTVGAMMFGGVAAFFAMKYLSRTDYYKQRQADEERAENLRKELDEKLVAIDKRLEVIVTGELKNIAGGMEEIRKELERGHETHEQLTTMLQALDKQMAVMKSEADGRRRPKSG